MGKKGVDPRNHGAGRKKGTPNRKTQTLEQFLDQQGIFIPERIITLLPTLESRDQAKVLLELMQYIFPKRRSHEHEFKPTDDQLTQLVKERLKENGNP